MRQIRFCTKLRRQPHKMWLLEKVTCDLFALAKYCLKQSYQAVDKIAASIERRAGPSARADSRVWCCRSAAGFPVTTGRWSGLRGQLTARSCCVGCRVSSCRPSSSANWMRACREWSTTRTGPASPPTLVSRQHACIVRLSGTCNYAPESQMKNI